MNILLAAVSSMEILTYPFSDPDPVPATDQARYPYCRYDGTTSKGEMRRWQTVVLENDRTKVTLLPEVGGKVWAATDKVTGRDYLYCNHVMKFRDIAMRGPWVSGGIEFNFGIIGHAPSSSTPVDWFVRTNADGSASCFISSAEYITRTIWQVEVRLGAHADGFETHVTWHNASGLPAPLYHWMNAAYSVRGNPGFLFPGPAAIGHQGEIWTRTWPTDAKGHDMSTYLGNAFGGPKSNHVLPGNNGFYAIWFPGQGFGSVHRSAPYEKFGRKIWLWALSREGGIWEDLLTDADGQYTELQSGLCFNQPRLDNYRTPFKHPTFTAGATMTFDEYWGPIRDKKEVAADLAAPQPETRPIDAPKDFDWSSAWGHYVRGVQYLRERSDREGAAELRAALEKDPYLAPAYGELAGHEMRRGAYSAVHELCRQALAIDAYDSLANYLDGFAHFVQGNGTSARERLGVAALDARYAGAALALVARTYLREKRNAEALKAAEKALACNPHNRDAKLVRLIAARGGAAAKTLAEEALTAEPLFHAARYELGLADGKTDFMAYVRNELPAESVLELGSWYAESGLDADAQAIFARAGENLMAKVRLGDFAAAKKLSVAGVFPFRREELPALARAVQADGHWKFRYLLGVLKAYLGFDAETDKLLDGCGDEPDEAVFYLYRASRRKGAGRLADLRRAQSLGDSWRGVRALANHYLEEGDYAAMYRETKAGLERFTGVDGIELLQAEALLKLKRYRECLDFLDRVELLPAEHRGSATDIWHAAQDALGLKRTWPEKLGRGEPYPPEKQ